MMLLKHYTFNTTHIADKQQNTKYKIQKKQKKKKKMGQIH